MNKPILTLDFDNVCHSYKSGWQGAAVIADPPVDGLFEFLKEAGEFFSIHIVSSRNAYPEGIRAMKAWFQEWGKGYDYPSLQFPTEKPPAFVGLDDRILTFRGEWPDVQELRNFKPWSAK